MKNKMIIGRYLPYDSFVHRLDPRTKLLAAIYYIVIIFFANNLATYFTMALIVLFGIYVGIHINAIKSANKQTIVLIEMGKFNSACGPMSR